MMQSKSPGAALSVKWRLLQNEQLDIRQRLAEDPPADERDQLVERFQSNRSTLAAIERGDLPEPNAEPSTVTASEPADEPPTEANVGGAVAVDDGAVGTAPQLLPATAGPERSSNAKLGKGTASLLALAAVIVAVGGVLVFENTSRQDDQGGFDPGPDAAVPQLESTSLALDREMVDLRTKVDNLGFAAIMIDVDPARGIVVLAGTVPSEQDRLALVDAARSTIDSARIDTTGIVLASPTLPQAGDAAPPRPTAPPRRIALLAPNTRADHSFSQSMADAVDTLAAERGRIELALVENVGSGDALDALRRHADAGFDLVIAHSSAFEEAVSTVAAEYPEVTFAVGTVGYEPILPNVYTYGVAVEEGGAILGAAAARASDSGVVGIIGPAPVGTSKRYIDAFEEGAVAEVPSTTVLVTYIGSFNDPAGAADATRALMVSGADVLAGQGHFLGDAVAAAEAGGALWIGNGVDQRELGPTAVLASQVYHWEVVLDLIVADVDAGVVDGRNLTADFGNGGLMIELNPEASTQPSVAALVEERLAAAVARGSDS